MTKLLETPKELADRVGIPVTNIRYLIREDMLDHIFTAPGKRNPKIPSGAWEKYDLAVHRHSRTQGRPWRPEGVRR